MAHLVTSLGWLSFLLLCPSSVMCVSVILSHPHGAYVSTRLRDAARKFSALKGNGDTVHIKDVGWGDLYGQIVANHTAGHGDDIVTVGTTWVSDLYDKGVLTALTEFTSWRARRKQYGDITRDFVRNLDFTYVFPDQEQKGASSSLEWHALPMNVDTRVLFYRRDLFLKYFGHDNAPVTLDEAEQMGRIIADGERAAGNLAMSGLAVPSFSLTSDVLQVVTTWVMGSGASFAETDESCPFISAAFQDALGRYTRLYTDGQHTFKRNTTDDIALQFSLGNVAIMSAATWLYWTLVAEGLRSDQLAASAMPAGTAGPFTFQGGSAWMLPTWVPAERRALAWEFIEYFMEPGRDGEENFLKDITFGHGLVAAYESTIRKARVVGSETVHLGGLYMFGSSGAGVDLTQATCLVHGSVHSGTCEPVLTGTGVWAAVWQQGQPIDFHIDLPAPVQVAAYQLKSANVVYEHDPQTWELSALVNGTWTVLHAQKDASLMPKERSTNSSLMTLDAIVVASRFHIRMHRSRGSLCAVSNGCEDTINQIPFAVPLHYPAKGFFKMGRMEANGTVQRMILRVHDGMDMPTSAGIACNELKEVLRDSLERPPGGPSTDTTPIIVISSVAAFLLLGVAAAGVLHRSFYTRWATVTIAKLKSDNDMAEDLACAVASLKLDSVEYLYTLKSPTRLQEAFIEIVSIITEYKRFLPQMLTAHHTVEMVRSARLTAPGEDTDTEHPSVAIVFTDIKGSTSLWDCCAEGMEDGMRVHNQAIRQCIAKWNGYEVKTIGDSFMVALDTAMAGLEFALDVQRELRDAPWPELLLLHLAYGRAHEAESLWSGLLVRIGVNYGPATLEHNEVTGRADYFGKTVNTAARLEGVCLPGFVAADSAMLRSECLEKTVSELPYKPLGVVTLRGNRDETEVLLLLPPVLGGRLACISEVESSPSNVLLVPASSETMSLGGSERPIPVLPNIGSWCSIDPTMCTVAHFNLVCTTDNWRDTVGVFSSISLALKRTEGSIMSVSGCGLLASWGLVRANPSYLENSFQFLSIVEAQAADHYGRAAFHAGLCTGTVQTTVLCGKSLSSEKFVTHMGKCVQVAEALASFAGRLRTRVLYGDLSGDLPIHLAPFRFTRPVFTWQVGVDSMTVLEISSARLLESHLKGVVHMAEEDESVPQSSTFPHKRELMETLGDTVARTQEYRSAFANKDWGTIAAILGSEDPIAAALIPLLESGVVFHLS